MRTLLTRSTWAALLLVGLLAGSAGAWSISDEEMEDRQIEFVELETFFTGTTPLGNLDTMTGAPVTWATDAPTGDQPSATVMNNYSTFVGDRDSNTFTTEGTFTGYLDTAAVDLYSNGPASALCPLDNLAFEVVIDGRTILFQEQSAPSSGLSAVQQGDYTITSFMFTRLFERMEDLGIEVGPDVTHEIKINMANFYACNESVVYYDAVDTPSRMIFNLDPDGRDARFYTEIDVYNPPPPLSD